MTQRPPTAALILIGALGAGCTAGPLTGEPASEVDSIPRPISACNSLVVTQNTYDGPDWWGTIKFKNNGTKSLKTFTVELDVPPGVHCTAEPEAVPAGAKLAPLTAGNPAHTIDNHCVFSWSNTTSLAPGASKTFNYSTDSQAFSAASNVVAYDPLCGGTTVSDFAITTNVYDGPEWWGTITFKNKLPFASTSYTVSFSVPPGAHCTAEPESVPPGATLSPLDPSGYQTLSNVCQFTWTDAPPLAPGASKTFNYSTDSQSFSAAINVVAVDFVNPGYADLPGVDPVNEGIAWAVVRSHNPLNGAGGWESPPASYNTYAEFQSNSARTRSTVTHMEHGGEYIVTIPGLDSEIGGTVLVNGYGDATSPGNEDSLPDTTMCNVVQWSKNVDGDLTVKVRCYEMFGGEPADAKFVVYYVRRTGGVGPHKGAYLWNNLASESGVPEPVYSWNSSGGTNHSQHLGPGRYEITLGGLGVGHAGPDPAPPGFAGNVQLSRYGEGAGHCKIEHWGGNGTHMKVFVACFSEGLPADSKFTLSFTNHTFGTPDTGFLWAWGFDWPEAYFPKGHYARVFRDAQFVGLDTTAIDQMDIGLLASGGYAVTVPNLGQWRHVPLVTAVGSDSAWCKVANFRGLADSLGRNQTGGIVDCFDESNQIGPHRFNVAVVGGVRRSTAP